MAHFSAVCWRTTRGKPWNQDSAQLSTGWGHARLLPKHLQDAAGCHPCQHHFTVPQRAWWMSHDRVWGRVKGTLGLPAGKLKFASLIQPFSASKERNHQVNFKEIDFCFLAKIFIWKPLEGSVDYFVAMCFFWPELNFRQVLQGDGGCSWPTNLNLISSAVAPAVQLTQSGSQVKTLSTFFKHPEHFNGPLLHSAPGSSSRSRPKFPWMQKSDFSQWLIW